MYNTYSKFSTPIKIVYLAFQLNSNNPVYFSYTHYLGPFSNIAPGLRNYSYPNSTSKKEKNN